MISDSFGRIIILLHNCLIAMWIPLTTARKNALCLLIRPIRMITCWFWHPNFGFYLKKIWILNMKMHVTFWRLLLFYSSLIVINRIYTWNLIVHAMTTYTHDKRRWRHRNAAKLAILLGGIIQLSNTSCLHGMFYRFVINHSFFIDWNWKFVCECVLICVTPYAWLCITYNVSMVKARVRLYVHENPFELMKQI